VLAAVAKSCFFLNLNFTFARKKRKLGDELCEHMHPPCFTLLNTCYREWGCVRRRIPDTRTGIMRIGIASPR